MTSTKEKKFYEALQDVFVGAKVDGQGGFINLMKIKSNYYEKIEKLLAEDIEEALDSNPDFREELFDKLHDFFKRYFTQNGSIHFNDTAFHNSTYEKIYTDEKDVVLFWKTRMLYYVKTDSLYQSMPVEFDDLKFYFDCSELEHKQANEKKNLIFSFKEIDSDDTIHLLVEASANGSKTKEIEILKAAKGLKLTEQQLNKAIRVFNRQSEIDYFINKNAKQFLQEQFKLWSYQYFWDGENEWEADRVNQLVILKRIAFKIIDFISQFEDELVKIWNKPKFVRNANYVITLDRLDGVLRAKIKKAEGYEAQLKEWQELGIDENNPKAPIDTKFFKELELDILSLFDDLDEALDGWLIKSENYQALNTIRCKFKEKVQTIYIDPPFNTGNDFEYVDRFQDSTWLTLMENRINISKKLLTEDGSYFLHLDKNATHYGKILLDKNIGSQFFKNEIIWCFRGGSNTQSKFKDKHQTIWFYTKNENSIFNWRDISLEYEELPLTGSWRGNTREEAMERAKEKMKEGMVPYDWWIDIPAFATATRSSEIIRDFSSQKPEKLSQRIIKATTDKKAIVLDYFLGTASTIRAAHKLNRKWIGIELGDHFYGYALPRLKEVLSCQGKNEPCGISEEENWQGGGFFKYYELEQYEDALAQSKYANGDSDLFTISNVSDYEQYVFMPDEKMLGAIELDYKNNKAKVDLSKLYTDIDIAETLSNLTGKWIRSITADKVIFADGEEVDIKDLDYKCIKPLIWWE